MHACIAAVSQCVPSVTLAYSKKAAGVMSLAGIPEAVVDLRSLSGEDAVATVARACDTREETKAALRQNIPRVKSLVADFFSQTLTRRMTAEGLLCHH